MGKCRHKKLLLGTSYIDEITPDSEPYADGVIEDKESISVNALVVIHYCERCQKIIDVKLESQ